MRIQVTYLDSGFFVISDRSAGQLAKRSAHGKLPKHGYEIDVNLPGGRAVLSRTQSALFECRRWRWSLHGPGVASLAPVPEYRKRLNSVPQFITL